MLRDDIIAKVALIEDLVGHSFRRRQLIYDAVVSPSYEKEDRDRVPDGSASYFRGYQKGALANIGDAVLDVIVTEHLLEGREPHVRAAEIDAETLTNGRIDLVNGERLTALSRWFGLERFLLLNKGEMNKIIEEQDRCSILGESFEAIVGALFLDGGLEPCRTFLRRIEFYNFKKKDGEGV